MIQTRPHLAPVFPNMVEVHGLLKLLRIALQFVDFFRLNCSPSVAASRIPKDELVSAERESYGYAYKSEGAQEPVAEGIQPCENVSDR
jgi:hypothetical protein